MQGAHEQALPSCAACETAKYSETLQGISPVSVLSPKTRKCSLYLPAD